MKISIITVSYNSWETIEKTINSVLSQTGVDLEYIVIDGGSKDGTMDIVNKYRDRIAAVVSEPDKGIYDAMNKGVRLTTGEVVGILNSDDFFNGDNVLAAVVDCLAGSDSGACYGDISYFEDDDKKTTRIWRAGEYSEEKLNNGWAMPHPALFVRKSVYDKIGLYRTDFRLAADYEFMLRLLKVFKIKVKYLPQILTRMKSGGASGRNLRYRLKGWQELKRSWVINNLPLPRFFILRRVVSKLGQVIKK